MHCINKHQTRLQTCIVSLLKLNILSNLFDQKIHCMSCEISQGSKCSSSALLISFFFSKLGQGTHNPHLVKQNLSSVLETCLQKQLFAVQLVTSDKMHTSSSLRISSYPSYKNVNKN